MPKPTPHSPGPWVVRENSRNDIFYATVYSKSEDSAVQVAAISYGHLTDTCEANLRLILAAPDLLAALQLIMSPECFPAENDFPIILDEEQAAIRAAIAKATGKVE